MLSRSINSAVLAALLLFPRCASQAPPSGGPPDRTPPSVVSTIPADKSVSVDRGAIVEIRFSEPMDRKSVERSVFLSPREFEALRFSWKGSRLLIRPGDSLAADRTYRFSIGAEGWDVYRNTMVSSYDFTFSTGETIHRGEITGRIRGGSGRPTQVIAFPLSPESIADPASRAPYVTQAGKGGDFTFPGLARGQYRVYAYDDADADQTYDPGEERLAIASEDVDLQITDRIRMTDVQLVSRDSVPPRPVTARTIDNRRIRLKMDEPVVLPIQASITSSKGSLAVCEVYVDAADSSIVYLVTDAQEEGAEYQIKVARVTDAFANVSIRDTTLTFKGDGRADKQGPVLAHIRPREGQATSAETGIVLTFDEAIVPDAGTPLWTIADSTLSPQGKSTLHAPNVLVFQPTQRLPGGTVRLRLNPSAIRDLVGNVSGRISDIVLETVVSRDLGMVSGTVEPDTLPVILTVDGIDVAASANVRVAAGDSTFQMVELVPGIYSLHGFLDRDDDGVWFAGSTHPFVHAEALLSRIDTIDVKARWETVSETRFSVGPGVDDVQDESAK